MPSQKLTDQKYLNQLETRQLWFGEIKQTADATRMGRMKVHIVDITGTDVSDTALFDCAWTSPFAGASQYSANPSKNEGATQTSYGMWMRPPDPGTQVVVGLIKIHDKQEPVILSCLFHQYRNFMVPGMPASFTGEGPNPSTEINMNNDGLNHNVKYTQKGSGVDVESDMRPKAKISDNLFFQGLADDFIRGQSTSGARREDNSEVFGILTPGSRKDGNPTKRNPGHQFVMDDNEANNLIRLRTGQGMQFLLNDTHNIIYIINKTGTGYVEIDGDGNIDIFGKGSFNVRTMGDLNLRADQNVNIEAGQDVNIKAANNSPHPYDEGRGLGGIVDDIDIAQADPIFGPQFLESNNKGTVNIEGHKKVLIKGQDLELNAQPNPMGIFNGKNGKIDILAMGTIKAQASAVKVDAIGRVIPKEQMRLIPGDISLASIGTATLRSTAVLTLHSTTLSNLEGALVNIASTITPPVPQIPMTPASSIKMYAKKATLFGFDNLPLPVPIPTQPKKQVQGAGLPTGLGQPNPNGPTTPVYEGTLFGGVKTIVTRMPQPEPSKSKKDKPFKG
jgi:hypothetical protein